MAFVAFCAFWPKIWKKSFQNLPKWSLGALKSESGASKIEPGALQDAIFKDLKFKKASKTTPRAHPDQIFFDFASTWLQLGSPKGSKMEAQTLKNRC